MSRKIIMALFIASFVLFAWNTATAQETSEMTREQLISLVQTLKAENSLLKVKLDLRDSASSTDKFKLNQELRQGLSGEEVKKLQQILATDPNIYPEGLVTGFYGSLTSQAVNRLQSKFKLQTRGYLTPETIELINAILASHGTSTTMLPPGLLSAPGLQNRVKIEMRSENGKIEYKIEVKCDSSGSGNQCKEDSDDDDELEIEAEIKSTNTKVKVEKDGRKYEFILSTTDKTSIVSQIATTFSLSEEEVKSVIEYDNEEDEDDSDEDDD